MDRPDLLFNVARTQLLAVLEAAVGVPIVGFAVEEDGSSGGDKQLSAFQYMTRDGETGKVTLFIKRCVWKARPEAVHYRHLTAGGVPTPHLYGALQTDTGEEIIFLEHLSAIGFRGDSEAEWRALLSLMARLNACPITPEYAPHLHPFEQVGRINPNQWITGLDAHPTDEEVAAGLRACGIGERELPALQQAARTLFVQAAAQPQGLLHQDFLPDNFGWRGERAELVIFDLHKNALGPRFADVAPYLALPDWAGSAATFLDNVENSPHSHRESLTRHYLNEYARYSGGPTVSPAAFRREITVLFWAHKVAALPWLAKQKQQARIAEVLDFLYQVPVSL